MPGATTLSLRVACQAGIAPKALSDIFLAVAERERERETEKRRMTEEIYSEAYFSSVSFDQDYASIADAIVRAYRPATVLDVGCGPGHLSRALAARGAQVVALDFYSKPDFREERISFHRCDLNSRDDLRTVSLAFPRLFDVAVCLEVVAHLKPEISD